MKKKKRRKFYFKVIAQERPLLNNISLNKARVKVLGGEKRATELLTAVMHDSEVGHTIISRAVRRYARKHPKWWEAFKLVTDMQVSDPPRL